MSTTITIEAGAVSARAELNDTPCAARIADALPIEAVVSTWGEEIYFDIGIACELEDDAREDVAVGEIGYWPAGRAFCIFFGPTPASDPGGPPRAASSVNVIGHILGDAAAFKAVRNGEKVILSPETC